jgi:hypothetical protein
MILSLSGETIFSFASTAWLWAVDLVGKVDGGEVSFQVGSTSEAAFAPRLQAVVCAFQSGGRCVSIRAEYLHFQRTCAYPVDLSDFIVLGAIDEV